MYRAESQLQYFSPREAAPPRRASGGESQALPLSTKLYNAIPKELFCHVWRSECCGNALNDSLHVLHTPPARGSRGCGLACETLENRQQTQTQTTINTTPTRLLGMIRQVTKLAQRASTANQLATFTFVSQAFSMAAASAFPTKQFAMGAKTPGGKLELVCDAAAQHLAWSAR